MEAFGKSKVKNISRIQRNAYTLIIIFLVFSASVGAALIIYMTSRYNHLIDNISAANAMNSLATDELNSELWEVVSGNISYEEGRQDEILIRLREQINRLDPTASSDIYALTLIHTLDSMGDYTSRLRVQMDTNTPVSECIKTVEEIEGITVLFGNMLMEYCQSEIDDIVQMSAQLHGLAILVVAAIIAMTLIAVCVSIAAYRDFRRSVDKPIHGLVAFAAKFAEGELDTRAETPMAEELILLTNSLNTMAEKIKQYNLDRIEEQMALKKAEVRTLQAQITPHFLYNTLDTIVWLSEAEKKRDTIEVTMALSRFFHISLSQGLDFIPLKTEMEQVRAYLTIQGYRYASKLSYTFDMDKELEDCLILKLLIQPLVENAIYHGIKNKRGRGTLAVNAKLLPPGQMEISVTDTGQGISAERLSELYVILDSKSDDAKFNFGLYNVNKRIRLYYGTAGLKIESVPQQGTTVSFRLPLQYIREEQQGV